MLVSTFELLVKPIAPAGAGPAGLARTVVQGYFLTIANTSPVSAPLRLTFTAITPNLNPATTVVIRDISGNVFGDLVPTMNPKQLTYNLRIPAHDTALVILQPDIRVPEIFTNTLEVRGYVEIAATTSGNTTYELLVTPEHRGTFFSGTPGNFAPDIDQLVYSLPTATGKAQYSVPQNPVTKSLVKDLSDVGGVIKQVENPKVTDVLPNPLENVQEMLLMMAERIEGLETLAAQGEAFIQPAERPMVAVRNGN